MSYAHLNAFLGQENIFLPLSASRLKLRILEGGAPLSYAPDETYRESVYNARGRGVGAQGGQ
jgi:hypothetical protein